MRKENKKLEQNSVYNPKEKTLLRTTSRRWGYNIKIDLKETGRLGVDWIRVIQGQKPTVGPCEHNNEPQ